MRGRTNITQRAVPYVNGDVIDAEVEYGSINTGDFVEYKTVTQIEEVSKTYNIVDERDTEHYKFVLLKENLGARIECHNKSDLSLRCFINFASSSANPSLCFDVIDESNFLFAISSYIQGNASSAVLYLAIENDEFVIKDTVQGSGLYVAISHISSNTYVASATATAGTGHTIQLRVGEYDYINKTVTHLGNKTFENLSVYGDQAYAYFQYISSNEFIYYATYKTSSGGSPTVYVYLLQYNSAVSFSDASITMLKKIQPTNYGINSYCKFLIISDHLAYIQHNVANTGNSYTAVINIIKYDSTNDTISAVVSGYSPYNLGYWYYQYNASLVSEKKIMVEKKVQNDQYYKVGVITYDEENNELVFSNDLLLEESGYILLKFCIFDNSDNLKVYYQGQSSAQINYIQSLIYLINTLSKSVDKNYVRQYIGNNAIGFAKTSGNVGDNIKVYVPHQS